MRPLPSLAFLTAAALVLGLPCPPGPAGACTPTGTPVFRRPLAIDNAYLPFRVRRIRLYEQTRGEGEKHVIDVFLSATRTFAWNGTDVACRVLQEWEVADGAVVEVSRNYLAQADDGTVWYFGETVDKYEDGVVVGHGGSWLVGGPSGGDPAGTAVAARPTVFMPARPAVGDSWKSEDLPAVGIEEFDRVVAVVPRLRTPARAFRRVLLVEERTPDVGWKWYAPGVGFVQQGSADETIALEEIIDAEDDAEQAAELAEILADLS